ncbi:hypothetical protein A2524_02725 [Candidatus Wolfebacteria bacterium RIFOXYD12_FULL_48_21]|uniref:Four helix bundle protein n=1 Tax=Candidatus Wolfebacteria bacterium RIFOXYD1_FULL_48_65 TaxID=1802561 RepID=A0A1F8E603_9BACT|nr:MAG: hypothetical protein A2524_02725 [Candidatus Wolfebacteria bacterium RIFOXYD12_FULL_48_21]OGM95405.1 MAG: hypothetical protein A2610_00805 [Candidatus Wolfebacteria bacterium RIFOXYD1_FULL_48_65]OGM95786.1 MAG: hypothetical protein A2532_00195 [Candidatus Wolfebacteria bacterium RIFOXYD2_FULL_48_11]
MHEFRFLEWSVYRDAKLVVKEIHGLIEHFPQKFKYSLGDQISRSSISIVLNIAEGSGKYSDHELNRYFNISLGSVNETVAALDLAKDNSLILENQFNDLLGKLVSISKQLGGFKKKIAAD